MSEPPAPPRRPQAFRLDGPGVRVASPGSVGPQLLDKPVVVVPERPAPVEASQDLAPAMPAAPRRWRFGALALSAAMGLAGLAAGVALARLVDDLFAWNAALGWAGAGLAALLALGLVGVIMRELVALRALQRVDTLRASAERVLACDDRGAAKALARDLVALYAARPDMAGARAEAETHAAAIVDGADLVRLTERALMADLDRRAIALVTASAKRISVVTALAPRAVFDVAAVLFESARLIRALAELYGVRPGRLGALKLARAVATQTLVSGGMAAGETLIQQLIGHGLAAKLSAKLGEGVVNGLMTARVGLATIDLVRPLPFAALERPRLGDVVAELTQFT